MPDLYFPANQGAAIIVDGIVYKRVSLTPVQHVPVGTISPGDTTNINDVTFDLADAQGDTVMPAERAAVAINEYTFAVADVGGKSYQTVFNYNCPVAGVIRMWETYYATHNNLRLYVNGINYGTPSGPGYSYARAANVNVGDFVQVYNNETYTTFKQVYVRIFPFEYTGSP